MNTRPAAASGMSACNGFHTAGRAFCGLPPSSAEVALVNTTARAASASPESGTESCDAGSRRSTAVEIDSSVWSCSSRYSATSPSDHRLRRFTASPATNPMPPTVAASGRQVPCPVFHARPAGTIATVRPIAAPESAARSVSLRRTREAQRSKSDSNLGGDAVFMPVPSTVDDRSLVPCSCLYATAGRLFSVVVWIIGPPALDQVGSVGFSWAAKPRTSH